MRHLVVAVVFAASLGCSGDDSTDTTDAASTDAVSSTDSKTSDVATISDAAATDANVIPDAAPPTDGGAIPDCKTPTVYQGYTLRYCTGYDTMQDLTYGGNGQLGSGVLSTTTFKTGPGSFYSKPANVSSGMRSEVQYGSNETPDEGMLEYDVMYEVIIPDNGHSLQFHPETSGGSASPGLWHIGGKLVLVNWKGGTNTQYPSGVTIQTQHWYHLKLEWKFASANMGGYLHLYLDGALVVNANNIQVGDGSGQYLKVGYNGWDNNSPNSRIYYDNLRVYAKP